jgi:Flp pilus assembly pilin Flp
MLIPHVFSHFGIEGDEMTNLLARLWKDEKGQDLTEYALLLALLALGAITSVGAFARTINNVFSNATTSVQSATSP